MSFVLLGSFGLVFYSSYILLEFFILLTLKIWKINIIFFIEL